MRTIPSGITSRTHSVSNRAKYRNQSTQKIGRFVKKAGFLTAFIDGCETVGRGPWTSTERQSDEVLSDRPAEPVDEHRMAHQVGPTLQSHSQPLSNPDRRLVLLINHADDVGLAELRERDVDRGPGRLGGIALPPERPAQASRQSPGRASPSGRQHPTRPTTTPCSRSSTAQRPKPRSFQWPRTVAMLRQASIRLIVGPPRYFITSLSPHISA